MLHFRFEAAPLNGVSPLTDYRVLSGVMPAMAASGVAPAASAPQPKLTSAAGQSGHTTVALKTVRP